MTKASHPDVTACIAEYFAARTQGPWAVSTGQAMARIRTALPDSTISDEDLVRMIADYAIMRGHNVTFDASENQTG